MARAGDSNAAGAIPGTSQGWPVGRTPMMRSDAGGSDAYSCHCRRYGSGCSGCVVYAGDRRGWRSCWP
jgi:hypothetical protein